MAFEQSARVAEFLKCGFLCQHPDSLKQACAVGQRPCSPIIAGPAPPTCMDCTIVRMAEWEAVSSVREINV